MNKFPIRMGVPPRERGIDRWIFGDDDIDDAFSLLEEFASTLSDGERTSVSTWSKDWREQGLIEWPDLKELQKIISRIAEAQRL